MLKNRRKIFPNLKYKIIFYLNVFFFILTTIAIIIHTSKNFPDVIITKNSMYISLSIFCLWAASLFILAANIIETKFTFFYNRLHTELENMIATMPYTLEFRARGFVRWTPNYFNKMIAKLAAENTTIENDLFALKQNIQMAIEKNDSNKLRELAESIKKLKGTYDGY